MAGGDRRSPTRPDVDEVADRLRDEADATVRAEMATRYGIHSDQAFGIPMRTMKAIARTLGTDHELAVGLWATGWYEARTVACLVDDPALVDGHQMDAWAQDFDNWAIVDTVCFNLFDRTDAAWDKVHEWSGSEREFVLRAALALLWALALHDRTADDEAFRRCLEIVEWGAHDDRHLVHKAAAMALRAITKQRPGLADDVRDFTERLVASEHRDAARIGRQARKDL